MDIWDICAKPEVVRQEAGVRVVYLPPIILLCTPCFFGITDLVSFICFLAALQ
jgi:hypothetical protein